MKEEDLGRVEYASLLYDFYGALLRENQNEVMAMYHEDNLSLSEIAEELGTTRQAVHYTLKKAEKDLAEYEDKLRLVSTYRRNRDLAARAGELISGMKTEGKDKEELLSIIRELSE